MGFLKVLRKRHLAFLWVSQVLSAMGDYFYQIAVLWIAVKMVGGAAGIVVAAETGSGLLFGLLGGVYADRWNRRTTMVAVDVLRALVVGTLPFVALAGTLPLWYLVLVAVLVGSLGALFDPTLQASLPALTGDTQTLQATNGLMDVTRRLARMLGPSLAGVLIAFIPLTHFFTLDAISFAISALTVFSLGRRYAWKALRGVDGDEIDVARGIRGIAKEIRGAFLLLRQHKLLLWAIAAGGPISVVWGAAFIVGVPLLASRVLNGGVGAYGLIVGAYGVGNVASNLVVSSLHIRRRGLAIFLGKLILGVGFLLLANSVNLWMALLCAAFAAIGGPMGDILSVTMIQTDLPADQIGKVFSLSMIVESAGTSLGLILAAPLYALFSVRVAIGLCAVLVITVGVAGLLRFGLTDYAFSLQTNEACHSERSEGSEAPV
jgi:MFS transporter, DHA3 family, macrolide efflux protein